MSSPPTVKLILGSASIAIIVALALFPLGQNGKPTSVWETKATSPVAVPISVPVRPPIIDQILANAPDQYARDAFSRKLSPTDRNEAMEELARRANSTDVTLLLALLDDQTENDILRSWGAQHIGMAFDRMSSGDVVTATERLWVVAKGSGYPRLARREAVFALAGRADRDPVVLHSLAEHIGEHINDDADSDLDNYARVVGICKFYQFRPRLIALSGHKILQISGAAKESLGNLGAAPHAQ